MKRILIIYLLSYFYYANLFSQDLTFEKVKNEYSLKDTFYFNVHNKSDSVKNYSVDMEILGENNEWFEIKDDIFNYTMQKNKCLHN
jgi:hypothetical protein